MNIQSVILENTTEAEWSYGFLSVAAGETKTLFNVADTGTYDLALWSLTSAIDAIYKAWEEDALLVTLNGAALDDSSWAVFRDTLTVLLSNKSCGYHGQPFCFDMKSNKLKIIHPLTGELYTVQLDKAL